MMFWFLLACHELAPTEPSAGPPPFGMVLANDNQLYAGVGSIDISPTVTETFTDLDADGEFDGCVNDPLGPDSSRPGCDEPFDDVNGNGYFDAIWIAGYGERRAATGVSDPLYARAVVLSLNGEYVALVGVDSVGLLESRVRQARLLLDAEGFEMDRVLVSSSHSHQSPDVVGIWGDTTALYTGINQEYIESLPPAIHDAVAMAAGSMVPVSPVVGTVATGEIDPDLNGTLFGGTSPNPHQIGTIDDLRDPIIVDDQLVGMAFDGPDGRLVTIMSFASHPETIGDRNTEVSADYVGFMRDTVEASQGGLAVFLSGALGGMMSAVTSILPALDDQGAKVTDAAGDTVWVEGESWELARSQGILLGQAVPLALTDSQPWTKIAVRSQPLLVPVSNVFYQVAFRTGLLDSKLEDLDTSTDCPGYGTDPNVLGCVPTGIWRVELGPATLATMPGELLPELFYGVPDDPAMADASLRSEDRRWDEHDPDCNDVPWADCKDVESVGDCDCLHYHAEPYVHATDGTPIIREMLPGTYRAPIGITNGYCGYLVPDPDFNTYVSQLTDDGDHYEETNSCSPSFTPLLLEAWVLLTEGSG